ncbi:hypothetical protein [Natrarchaeobaculum aegyptiacum]|uniref:Cox cluster protein n=1 Tax=Natrarchaeobaculum aegyptiacum TaxID=745377 RepID=A0A2Z2I0S8_9EURY|nr:hypothetical protein [Natrarchaeobaculum aegyptiacum]ARS89838.1 hypothetical protein B1756_08860 [Natrarchaeobaculum aegyptiacum]
MAGLLAQFREYPVATTLEVGSVVVCIVLFVGTLGLLALGPPVVPGTDTGPATGTATTPWLALVGVGAAFVLFWTALVPLYERLR